MKYTLEITLNLPRPAVVKKFDNPENRIHWQRGLKSYSPISGIPGEVGAKCKLKYRIKNREVIMTETVIRRKLPDKFYSMYEAKGVISLQKNYFVEIDEETTKWTTVSEFKFTSLMMKIMGVLTPGAFKKQSYKYLLDFKDFAEKNSSIAHLS